MNGLIKISLCLCMLLCTCVNVCVAVCMGFYVCVCIFESLMKNTLRAKVGHKCDGGCLARSTSSVSGQHRQTHTRRLFNFREPTWETENWWVGRRRIEWQNDKRFFTRPPGATEKRLTRFPRFQMNSFLQSISQVCVAESVSTVWK